MIDHFTVSVSDYARSVDFYTRALAPLGYRPLMEFPSVVGFGDTKPYFWLKKASPVTTPQHIAFRALTRAHVDAFHRAALAAGARNDGDPGVRKQYHPDYYGAFVIDPVNGHPLEAVCHLREGLVGKPRRARTPSKATRKAIAALAAKRPKVKSRR